MDETISEIMGIWLLRFSGTALRHHSHRPSSSDLPSQSSLPHPEALLPKYPAPIRCKLLTFRSSLSVV
jgi:hypothetical protein